MPVVWNKEKKRVLYREDLNGNRVYPNLEDDPREIEKKEIALEKERLKKENKRLQELEIENKKLKEAAKKKAPIKKKD